ncbi:MAG: photosynthetic complex assembly protein PuhC [Halieaceae bacterium]|jgi:putative photosynthetic complex assembly protein|nr:photosynthetic complex assembly protein PuhC [Halieaceae bacterium]
MKSTPFISKHAPYLLGGIVVLALLSVVSARWTGIGQAPQKAAAVVSSCQLRFEDGAAGSVEVYDWQGGALLASFPSGDGSFVRGVLRSMTRERRGLAAGSEQPFRLARHSDGALTIRDEFTGHTILLNAFGPTNAAVFADLLDASQADS